MVERVARKTWERFDPRFRLLHVSVDPEDEATVDGCGPPCFTPAAYRKPGGSVTYVVVKRARR